MFGKLMKVDYNKKLIILSWKIAYKHNQFFGAYDYKQKLIILKLLCFYQIDLKY